MRTIRWILFSLALVTSGCLTHTLPWRTEYRQLRWSESLADAQARALVEDKLLLLVLGAGELNGPCCAGADVLRSEALSDPKVIAFINDGFVPVWLNVRREAIPDLPDIDLVLTEAALDRDRRVIDLFSNSFFVRSAVYTPDGRTLLNPAANNVAGSIETFVEDGHFAFAEMTPAAYLTMLRRSLARNGRCVPLDGRSCP